MLFDKIMERYSNKRRKIGQTEAERAVYLELGRLGVRRRIERHVGRYIFDIMLPLKRVLVEVDGGYHNGYEQRIKDKEKQAFAESLGWTVARITNEDALNKDRLKSFCLKISAIRNVRYKNIRAIRYNP